MGSVNARDLTLTVGGTEYATQVFSAQVESAAADSDDVTYAEASTGGGRQYNLVMTLTQDMVTSSLWSQIWDNAGDDIAVLMRPYGNSAASLTQPHFSMSANIREPDGVIIGGTADVSPSVRQQTEVTWPLAAKPTKVTS